MTEKNEKSLLGEGVKLEFSDFKLLDQGFGFGHLEAEEKREKEHRRRDLGLLAKMRTELQGHKVKKSEKIAPEASKKEELLALKKLPVLKESLSEKQDEKTRALFLQKLLPPPLVDKKRNARKPKKTPIEAVLKQQLKKVPPPKEELLAKAKLEKARKQIRKKSSPTSFSFFLLGHVFDLLVVVSLLFSEVLLLSFLFKRDEIFLLDVVFRKFNLTNLTFFSVLEGVSFLYLAYFLYYLLFSFFLGRSLGFFFLLKMRKNTQNKKA